MVNPTIKSYSGDDERSFRDDESVLDEERGPLSKDNNGDYTKATKDHKANRESFIIMRKNDEDDDDDNTMEEHELEESVFSFVFVGKIGGIAFSLGIVVFAFQMLLLMLAMVNLIEPDSDINPLKIPANVDLTVTIAGYMAMLLAVATQDDLVSSMVQMHIGYNERYKALGSGATYEKFLLSCILQFLAGLALIVSMFILISQSDTVISMMLNFAALEFLSSVDDVAFALCKRGFFTDKLQDRAENVADFKVKIIKKPRFFRRLVFLLIFLSLITGYSIIVIQQQSGAFLCQKLYVQFGDDFQPKLGAFSGLYRISSTHAGIGQYTTYESDDVNRIKGRAFFGYCESEGAWTFTISDAAGKDDYSELNACDEYTAISSSTESYDILDTASSDWYAISNEHERQVVLNRFAMFCHDCKKVSGYCGDDYDRGSCEDNECICKDDWFGLRCEFSKPCSNIAVDSRSEAFTGDRPYSNSYKVFYDETNNNKIVRVYNNPVYISTSPTGDPVDIILFTGRRWIVTSIILLDRFKGTTSMAELAEYLQNDFHAHFSKYESSFISGSVDVDTETDGVSPVGLEWYAAESREQSPNSVQPPDLTREVKTILLCAVCDNGTNPCSYQGKCLADGSCDCQNGATGILCQIAPLSNGFCNNYFNEPKYSFDGGDCCEASCLSTLEHTCGTDESGVKDSLYNCSDPQHICSSFNETCWKPNGETVFGSADFAESGTATALSADGSVLAVSEPGTNSVRIFDKDGSSWKQRGKSIDVGAESVSATVSLALSGDGSTLAVVDPGYLIYERANSGCCKSYGYGDEESGDEASTCSDYECNEGGDIRHYSEITCSLFGDRWIADDNCNYNEPGGRTTRQLTTYRWSDSSWNMMAQSIVALGIDDNADTEKAVVISQDGRLVSYYGRNWFNSFNIRELADDTLSFKNYFYGGEQSHEIYTGTEDDDKHYAGHYSNYKIISQSFSGHVISISASNHDGESVTFVFKNLLPSYKYKTGGTCYLEGGFVVRDCSCHFTCSKCRYASQSDQRPESRCIECADGTDVTANDDLGIGYCTTGEQLELNRFVQIGQTIFGCCNQLSKDGNVLAVGVLNDDSGESYTTETYDWNEPLDAWIKRNETILGVPMAISFDGSVVVVKNDASIQSFYWNDNEWKEVGSGIPGSPGASVAQAGFAPGDEKLAVGLASDDEGGQNRGAVNTYHLVNPQIQFPTCESGNRPFLLSIIFDGYPSEIEWQILSYKTGDVIRQGGAYDFSYRHETINIDECLSEDVCFEFTINDSSNDGLCCGFGIGGYSLFFDDSLVRAGSKFVQSEKTLFGNCNCKSDESRIQVEVTTNKDADFASPAESWYITDELGQVLLADNYTEPMGRTKNVDFLCVPDTSCVTLTLQNEDDSSESFIDVVSVFVDNEKVNPKYEYINQVNDRVWASSARIGNNCAPTSSPTFNHYECEEGRSSLHVEVSTSEVESKWRISWDVVDMSDPGTKVLQREYNDDDPLTFIGTVDKECVPIDHCLAFSLVHGEDSPMKYALFVDEAMVSSGEVPSYGRDVVLIGDSCTPTSAPTYDHVPDENCPDGSSTLLVEVQKSWRVQSWDEKDKKWFLVDNTNAAEPVVLWENEWPDGDAEEYFWNHRFETETTGTCIQEESCLYLWITSNVVWTYRVFLDGEEIASTDEDKHGNFEDTVFIGNGCSPTTTPTMFTPTSEECEDIVKQSLLRIEFDTRFEDNDVLLGPLFPVPVWWDVVDLSEPNFPLIQGGNYTEKYFATHIKHSCIKKESCYTFSVRSSEEYREGDYRIRGVASYRLYLDDEEIAFLDGGAPKLVVQFGDGCPPTVAPTPSPTTKCHNDPSWPEGQEVPITIEITMDNYPDETSWFLELASPLSSVEVDGSNTNGDNGDDNNSNNNGEDVATATTILMDQSSYSLETDRLQTFVYDTCVLLKDVNCLVFYIRDSSGNGICCNHGIGNYKLFMDGIEIATGGTFAGSEEVHFGNCTTTEEGDDDEEEEKETDEWDFWGGGGGGEEEDTDTDGDDKGCCGNWGGELSCRSDQCDPTIDKDDWCDHSRSNCMTCGRQWITDGCDVFDEPTSSPTIDVLYDKYVSFFASSNVGIVLLSVSEPLSRSESPRCFVTSNSTDDGSIGSYNNNDTTITTTTKVCGILNEADGNLMLIKVYGKDNDDSCVMAETYSDGRKDSIVAVVTSNGLLGTKEDTVWSDNFYWDCTWVGCRKSDYESNYFSLVVSNDLTKLLMIDLQKYYNIYNNNNNESISNENSNTAILWELPVEKVCP